MSNPRSDISPLDGTKQGDPRKSSLQSSVNAPVGALDLGIDLSLGSEGGATSKNAPTAAIVDVLGPGANDQVAAGIARSVPSDPGSVGVINDASHNSQITRSEPVPTSVPNGNGLKGSSRYVPGSPESAAISSTNSTTTNVQICQRLDEVAARLITMENSFNKLHYKLFEQESTIQQLKIQNERVSNAILTELRKITSTIPVPHDNDDNEKDGFVTDLLNSITNVSSNYLQKIKSRNSQKGKRHRNSISGNVSSSENQTSPAFINERNGNFAVHEQHTPKNQPLNLGNASEPALGVPRYLSQQSFTLNPNGIKKRKVKGGLSASRAVTMHPSYQDLVPASGMGSISFPCLTLDSLVRRNNLSDEQNINGSSNLGAIPAPLSAGRRGVDIQIGSGDEGISEANTSDSTNDEDGYQEDDEDRRGSSDTEKSFTASKYGIQRGGGHNDANMERSASKNRHTNGGHEPTKNDGASTNEYNEPAVQHTEDLSVGVAKKAAGSSGGAGLDGLAVPPQRGTAARDSNEDHDHVTTASRSEERDADLNYTLLKAPANVRAIWQEYINGLDGNPPVKYLEETYGNKWRLKKNVKTFARRKRLYKFIQNGIKKGRSAEEMIDLLEKRRIYKNEHGEIKKRTIGWLQQSLSGI
ncbi:LAMI_0G09714g1_1 [Lachancea mirantina]|uniref:LAMI_0G09714g1_1 n=1 Tax=Lachancea mirantina TaxID=1230905 RepID=A0A1G4KAE2_9SACH|nr:LAMI_0G09714g1_1 [Lachancea mirantina]